MALGGRKPVVTIQYGARERRRVYDSLNANGRDTNVDYVMLGCPHASIEQFRDVARCSTARRSRPSVDVRIARGEGGSGFERIHQDHRKRARGDDRYVFVHRARGPDATKVAAVDSAKQVHYLPAMTGVKAWFEPLEDCINAALTRRWKVELRMIVLRGRGTVGGCAEGEALVTRQTHFRMGRHRSDDRNHY